jgi:predicted lipoprotein
VLNRCWFTTSVLATPEFKVAASGLETSVTKLCNSPSDKTWTRCEPHFRGTVESWSRVEWLRLGPVMSENRLERILFFPDRKGTGRKQVEAAIAARQEAVTEVATLAGQSVAMQGLGALEFILFGSGSDALAAPDASHRCAYARAASTNLVDISDEIIAGWRDGTGLAQAFLEPAAGNPLFRTDKEALNLLLGQMIHGLEAIRDTRVTPFSTGRIPAATAQISPFLAFRHDDTVDPRRIEGLEALFNESGIEVVSKDMAPRLADTIRFEFGQAISTARTSKPRSVICLPIPKPAEKLLYLDYAIKIVIGRLDRNSPRQAGLRSGFRSEMAIETARSPATQVSGRRGPCLAGWPRARRCGKASRLRDPVCCRLSRSGGPVWCCRSG